MVLHLIRVESKYQMLDILFFLEKMLDILWSRGYSQCNDVKKKVFFFICRFRQSYNMLEGKF